MHEFLLFWLNEFLFEISLLQMIHVNFSVIKDGFYKRNATIRCFFGISTFECEYSFQNILSSYLNSMKYIEIYVKQSMVLSSIKCTFDSQHLLLAILLLFIKNIIINDSIKIRFQQSFAVYFNLINSSLMSKYL